MSIPFMCNGGAGSGTVFPAPIVQTRAPSTTDKIDENGVPYQYGRGWVNKTAGAVYVYVGGGIWVATGGGSADVNTLSADSGGNLSPTGGNIAIAGGTNITTAGAGSTITVNLDTALTGLSSIAATTYTTNVAAAQLSISGTTVAAIGTDANINITHTPKGTGDSLFTVGDINASGGDVIASRGNVGGDVTLEATNTDNTNGASRGGIEVATGGASSGDPYVDFLVSGAGHYIMGIDNSDSDNFKLSTGGALGTTDNITVTSAGVVTVNRGAFNVTTGPVNITDGNLTLGTAGNGVTIKEGSNARMGTATLVAGTVTIANTSVTANTRIFISRSSIGATGAAALGILTVGTVTPATSFIIRAAQAADATADQASDVSVVDWLLVEGT